MARVSEQLTVVFVAGWGRSGSTLLDRVLGQIDGFFSAGEVRYLWDRGLLEGSPCSCWVSARECPVWSRAAGPYLARTRRELEQIVALRDSFRTRHCALNWWPPERQRLERRLRPLAEHLLGVYRGLALATGSRVIVDSSKFPSHGYLLRLMSGIDLVVLHLVRDPRGVAFSWRKRKVYDTVGGRARHIPVRGAWSSSVYWTVWNTMIELLWASDPAYRRIRYEDWAAAPRTTLARFLEDCGLGGDVDFFDGENLVRLESGHLISGNPQRFWRGPVEIAADEAWRTEMPRWDRVVATLLSAPLLVRYGYPLSARRPGASPSTPAAAAR